MRSLSPLALTFLAAALAQAGGAALLIAVPLKLAAAGESAAAIGGVGAMALAGALTSAAATPLLAARIGAVLVALGAAATLLVLSLVLALPAVLGLWGVVLFLVGAGNIALHSALDALRWEIAGPVRRLRWFETVQIATLTAGTVLGFAAVSPAAPGGALGALAATLFFALCVAAIALTVTTLSEGPGDAFAARGPEVPLAGGFTRVAPSAAAAAGFGGFIAGAIERLAPLHAAQFDAEAPMAAAGGFFIAVSLGAAAAVLLAGPLSANRNPRVLIGAFAGAGAIACAMLAVFPASAPSVIWASLAFVLGAALAPLFTLALLRAGDRAPPEKRAAARRTVFAAWVAAGALGAFLGGWVMASPVAGTGLFWLLTGLLIMLALIMWRPVRDGDAMFERARYPAALPTSPYAADIRTVSSALESAASREEPSGPAIG